MTVYVDNARLPYGRMLMSHMVSEDEWALHDMARFLHIPRRHYQGDHYDICQTKRKLAVAAGAVEITMRQAAIIRNKLRRKS